MCNCRTSSRYNEPRSHDNVSNRFTTDAAIIATCIKKIQATRLHNKNSAFLPIVPGYPGMRDRVKSISKDKGDERELFLEVNLLLSDLCTKSVAKACK